MSFRKRCAKPCHHRGALFRAPGDDTAAVPWLRLTPNEFAVLQPVEGAGDRSLVDLQLLRQFSNCLWLVRRVDGQLDSELA